MKKITLLLFAMLVSTATFAQHTFPVDAGVYTVPDATTTVPVAVNDAGNAAAAPAGQYATFEVTADWSITGGDAWSSEARLVVTTTAGTTIPAGPISGGASSDVPTTLTFGGTFPADYDPSVDGYLELGLSRTYSSPADWTNITVTIVPALTCAPAVATTALVEDCGNTQFSIDVDVTDLGDSGTLTIANDAGVASTDVMAIGMVNVGPFPAGTPVVISLNHETDPLCNVDLASVVDNCPTFSAVDCAVGTPVNTTYCYGENDDAGWLFTSSDGSALRIDFIEGYLEDCCDTITIYDGTDNTGAVLYATDTNINNDVTGITAISTGDSLFVNLTSDGSVSCAAGSGSGIPISFDVACNTCTPSTYTATVVDDCGVSGGFNIEVEVTDLGSATSLTISDDQASPTQAVVAPGTYTFGPYVLATDVVMTVANDQDAACTSTTGVLSQVFCPPTNNDCVNATPLTPGTVFTDNSISGNNGGATGSGELPLPGCASYDPDDASGNGGDVWYSVVVPANGEITLEVNSNGGITDTGGAAYSGSCGALNLIDCNDDGSANGAHPIIVISDLALAGQTIYFRVWEYSGNAAGTFEVSAYSGTLSAGDFEATSFKYYPNPVSNVLTLNAQSNIDMVVVNNMLGQEVLRATPNSLESEIDFTSLNAGAYFVNVSINGTSKVIRIIKN
ncbi:hypothetical protein A9Q87_00705 [Flavobacteriales bacterium 34_180_T64]|nr:hypothetical protein A9Q87_00705 [Flavobacteriales bacterium 34_180_T64]